MYLLKTQLKTSNSARQTAGLQLIIKIGTRKKRKRNHCGGGKEDVVGQCGTKSATK